MPHRALSSFVGLLIASALAFAACGGVEGSRATEYARPNPGKQVLRLRWIKPLTPPLPNFVLPQMQEEHDRFFPIERSAAGFDTDKKRAFIGASVGGLYCLDIGTGATIWRFGLDHPVASRPIYDQARKYVYFGADDGNVYALHARSGRLIWKVGTGSQVRNGFHLYENTLYFSNADNTVFAVLPSDGRILWQHRRPPVEGFASSGYAGLTFDGTNIITGFSDGYVQALDASSGAVIWSRDLVGEVMAVSAEGQIRLVDADATPVVLDGVLAVASVAGGLWGLDPESGNVVWTRPDLTQITGLAGANGMIYAARSGRGLEAVAASTGHTVWSRQIDTGVLQSPLIHDDVLVIADSERGMNVVSTASGELLQRLETHEGFFAEPASKAGYLLILGNRGTLFAMSIL